MPYSLQKMHPGSISWAVDELRLELNQALRNLEEYAENSQSPTLLEDCVQHLKQVAGIFAVANLALPAMLSQELQQAAQNYGRRSSQQSEDLLSALAEGILELSNYLGSPDQTYRLIPAVNNLRALSERELFTESTTFEVALEEGLSVFKRNFAQTLDSQTIRKLRLLYQRSMLSIIKSGLDNNNSAGTEKVFKVLYQMGGTAYLSALGYAGLALMERLKGDHISLTPALKTIFKRIDEVLSKLISGSDYVDMGLLKNALYYSAVGQAHGTLSTKLINIFQLGAFSDSIDEKSSGSSMGSELVSKVVEAIHTEIEQAKTWLDNCFHNVCELPEAINEVDAILKRVDDTLVMVNVETPRVITRELLDVLNGWRPLASETDIEASQLDRFAVGMVRLETELQQLAHPLSANDNDDSYDFGEAKSTLLIESRTALSQIKSSITQFIEENWQWSLLREVPASLAMVEGAVRFYPIEDLASVVNCVRRYVREALLERRETPDQREINLLADVIVAIDYYLECLERGTAFNLSFLIERALENCAELGYTPEQDKAEDEEADDMDFIDSTQPGIGQSKAETGTSQQDSPEQVAKDMATPEDEVTGLYSLEDIVAKEYDTEGSQIKPAPDKEKSEATDEEIRLSESLEAPDDKDRDQEPDSEENASLSIDNDAQQVEVEQETVEDASQPTSTSADEDDSLENSETDEIIDIFVEEANEILPLAKEQLAEWRSSKDRTALMDLRRGFHTLKGGGRMIGAAVTGELSWAIENLLNRVIEGSQESSPEIHDLVEKALAEYPSLLDQLTKKGSETETDQIKELQVQASQLSDPSFKSTKTEAPVVSELTKTFASEAEKLRQSIVQLTAAETSGGLDKPPSEELVIALDRLGDIAQTAEYDELADTIRPLQKVVRHFSSVALPISNEFITTLSLWSGKFSESIGALEKHGDCDTAPLHKIAETAEDILHREERELAQDSRAGRKKRFRPLHRLMAEELEKLIIAEEVLSDWHAGQSPAEDRDQLLADLILLTNTAMMCRVDEIAEICELIKEVQQKNSAEEYLPEEAQDWLNQAYAQLLTMLDAVASWQVVPRVLEGVKTAQVKLLNQTDIAVVDTIDINSMETVANDSAIEPVQEVKDTLSGQEASEEQEASPEPETSSEQETSPEQEASAGQEELLEQETSTAQEAASEPEELAGEDKLLELDEPELSVSESILDDLDLEVSKVEETTTVEQSTPGIDQDIVDIIEDSADDEFQRELLDTFIEEAEDLVGEISSSLRNWRSSPADFDHADAIHRALHTLKGGARLSGLKRLGDNSHDFESFIIDQQVLRQTNDDFFRSALERLDLINENLDQIKAAHLAGTKIEEPSPPAPAVTEVSTPEVGLSAGDTNATEITTEAEALPENDKSSPESAQPPAEANTSITGTEDRDTRLDNLLSDSLQIGGLQKEQQTTEPSPPPPPIAPETTRVTSESIQASQQAEQDTRARNILEKAEVNEARPETRQEQIRLRADIVEEMVNLSSESTVYRGRVEAQLSDVENQLDELESTIGRIQQLSRRLDVETAAQIQFRSEQIAEVGDSDFDPLEMDRYSTLQQLSRQLIESASDLQDLRGSLVEGSREVNVLLVQSGRIQSELNDHLMRTRMVPFDRIVPRLERIVRQVSRELKKKAELLTLNVEGELDRQVLEQLVPPIEHILRNAIDHGIEAFERRQAIGKPEYGRITMNIRRDGSYMLLTIADDGAGLNYDAIRSRAVNMGLYTENAVKQLDSESLAELLFTPGFSTATSVTQISGRGVGMDVVRSTLRSMGGTITINSQPGQGTQFELSIPFTLSVNRALMVTIGDDRYAIPLASLEALVRLSRSDLESYYKDTNRRLSYGADEYDFGYLGELLQTLERPMISALVNPTVSVILFRSGPHRIALLVDEIAGSQEVVVKSLNAPFSSVPGLLGAAIMGDGSTVVTLDMPTLIRSFYQQSAQEDVAPIIDEETDEDKTPTIMVVDDSVTVRKVTSRFLNREGFVVESARDGVEALRQINEQAPDLMLVDVEMPRMDGFELLSVMRSSERFKTLPVILVTSRTGEKHRERGLSLGAQSYFGKPFREDQLLEEINKLISESREQRH